MWNEYLWIVIIGSFTAFLAAYGIGANDVANSFATSVGAKAISLKQAVIIASICELAGAVLMGASVANTVSFNIAKDSAFEDEPEVLMYGMLCVLAATALWLITASFLELPVSTTHSVIGGILGMALTAKGGDAIIWIEYNKEKEFLTKLTGVVPIIVSWILSPVLSAIIALILFFSIRHFVMRSDQAKMRAIIFFPILVGFTITVNTYFIIYKGFKRKFEYNGEKQRIYKILGPGLSTALAFGFGIISGITVWLLILPYVNRRVEEAEKRRQEKEEKRRKKKEKRNKNDGTNTTLADRMHNALNRDLHDVIEKDKQLQSIHSSSEKFDPNAEEVFKYVQVFTAMCDSFAHGANDVANSVAPFAVIYSVYIHGQNENIYSIPEWILALGGLGLSVGLATFGYKIIRAIGIKLVSITPSRGFSIELGTAIVIILGSRYGIPLSTTHCQVGATVGVGAMEGKSGVNIALLIRVITGWIITLLVVGLTAALFFAQGIYSPSLNNLNDLHTCERGVEDACYELYAIPAIAAYPNITDVFIQLNSLKLSNIDKRINILDDLIQQVLQLL